MTTTLHHLRAKLQRKLHLPAPPGPREVDALWQLFLAEVGLQGTCQGACQLFDEADLKLLEWVEDVRVWEAQGPGAAVNYRMAGPLLGDMLASLQVRPVADGAPPARDTAAEKDEMRELLPLLCCRPVCLLA